MAGFVSLFYKLSLQQVILEFGSQKIKNYNLPEIPLLVAGNFNQRQSPLMLSVLIPDLI